MFNNAKAHKIKDFITYLEKNYNRNFLNVDFWNKKLFIDDYSKNINNDFEQSFINIFLLTKNNEAKN